MTNNTWMWKALFLASFLTALPLPAQNRDPVNRLLDRIVANENQFLSRMKRFHPIFETYVQALAEGADPDDPPASDYYIIGRLDLTSGGIDQTPLLESAAFEKHPRSLLRLPWIHLPAIRLPLPFHKGSSGMIFEPAGFAQMVVIDADEFNRATYRFAYVRREFLGDVRCLVFDISPRDRQAAGKFIGRFWVEDKDYRVVRFNGTYTRSTSSGLFFHFDSWRVNVAPGLWAPAAIYVEDAAYHEKGRRFRFKAQTRLWGYHAGAGNKLQELTNILVDAGNPVEDRSGSKDVSPLEGRRSWEKQAEENVLYRLEQSALLAPKGEADQVLNTVVNNLMVTNHINLDDVQCRVMLTTPLETFSVGRAIVVSRGLLDVLPDEASLAMVLANELAHIVLGHRMETMYAFSDETLFPQNEVLSRLRFTRTPEEVESAGKKAVEILSHSPYKDKLAGAGLFLKALQSHAPRLPNLIQASVGNGLANAGHLLRLEELIRQAPPLEEGKIEQIAALPLGSRIRLDPWNDQVALIQTKPAALLSAREKMPFEVTPFLLHLTRITAQAGKPAQTTQNR
ncbi:MAG TPA: M48 family metalloprotease [Bryobacterales bacterium]|nr:M48 family metalloprotease [Bryobacterales bacterium]